MNDPADASAVAREHFAWCRSRRQSLREIAASVGHEMQPFEGEDDVLLLLEMRWLQIIPTTHRTQQEPARRAA